MSLIRCRQSLLPFKNWWDIMCRTVLWFKSTWKSDEILRLCLMSNNDNVIKNGSTCILKKDIKYGHNNAECCSMRTFVNFGKQGINRVICCDNMQEKEIFLHYTFICKDSFLLSKNIFFHQRKTPYLLDIVRKAPRKCIACFLFTDMVLKTAWI